tara:strand:- start:50 stop:613 length:564 start_codon:yes stop_codon:yes gene_type:complete
MKLTDYSSAKTLEECYTIQEATWNSEHSVHRNTCLIDFAKQSDTIMEIGVNQGSSLMIMAMQNPKSVIGVDITFKNFNLRERIEDYCSYHSVKTEFIEASSTDPITIRDVEMLHIDGLHHPKHVVKELSIHASHVSKFIAFHDINLGSRGVNLWDGAIQPFLKKNNQWETLVYYDQGKCGNAVIGRK